jgi:hypothetical protein
MSSSRDATDRVLCAALRLSPSIKADRRDAAQPHVATEKSVNVRWSTRQVACSCPHSKSEGLEGALMLGFSHLRKADRSTTWKPPTP